MITKTFIWGVQGVVAIMGAGRPVRDLGTPGSRQVGESTGRPAAWAAPMRRLS